MRLVFRFHDAAAGGALCVASFTTDDLLLALLVGQAILLRAYLPADGGFSEEQKDRWKRGEKNRKAGLHVDSGVRATRDSLTVGDSMVPLSRGSSII